MTLHDSKQIMGYGWYLEKCAPLYSSTCSSAGCLETSDF